MIKNKLDSIAKYIPSYWPLQSFVPCNPLVGLTSRSFSEVLHEVARFAPIYGTLKIEEYHKKYYAGNINLSNLQESVQIFVKENNIDPELTNYLTALFLDKSFQHELEILFSREVKVTSILISNHLERREGFIESQKVKSKLLKFFSSFFDLGQAKWQLPVSSNQLFVAWKEYTVVESKELAVVISTLPHEAELAVEHLLKVLKIPEALQQDYLLEILFKVIGWASLVKWLEHAPGNPYISREASLASICAIWLCYESVMPVFAGFNLSANHAWDGERLGHIIGRHLHRLTGITQNLDNVFTRYNVCLIWQKALELNYQNNLLNMLLSNPIITPDKTLPDAQVVFCIDIRSEGMRRNIENHGNYATYGYAGYFGIGFKFNDLEQHTQTLQTPPGALPSFSLDKLEVKKSFAAQIRSTLELGLGKTKRGLFAPVVLFDVVGLWFSLKLFYKTLIPRKRGDEHSLDYSSLDVFAVGGFKVKQLAEIASSVLRSIGLNKNFARFIIITGHKTECENNPYESSLNCGACGSNAGIPNAVAFCQALNNKDVRLELSQKFNLQIPDATVFISACHNTATDELIYFNQHLVSDEDKIKFKKIKHDFELACNDLKQEKRFNQHKLNSSNNRKVEWAELIPELGQANNAAFIIGPRKLSRRLNLSRRTFLQSYDPESDTNGDILESIFRAPLLIAHGINLQYYFSATDQGLYGSGNKALQNIIARLGVIEGNSSDLKIGYSKQSVSFKNTLIHEPLRLYVVVYAKAELVNKILARNPDIADLFNGYWATLKVIEV